MPPPRFDELAAVPHQIVARIARTEQLDLVTAPLARAVGNATRQTQLKNALSGTWLGHHRRERPRGLV